MSEGSLGRLTVSSPKPSPTATSRQIREGRRRRRGNTSSAEEAKALGLSFVAVNGKRELEFTTSSGLI